MRCHAAEWGAVTGRFGPHKPGADRRTGGPVGFRKEAASAVKAWLHGPGGRAGLKIRLDQGVALHTSSGPEEWPGDEIKHRGGAPVGVRPTLLGAHASPGVLFKCDADRRSTPSPVWEKGKRDGRCAPASFGRGGGAMPKSMRNIDSCIFPVLTGGTGARRTRCFLLPACGEKSLPSGSDPRVASSAAASRMRGPLDRLKHLEMPLTRPPSPGLRRATSRRTRGEMKRACAMRAW